jgi:hypothetical protein
VPRSRFEWLRLVPQPLHWQVTFTGAGNEDGARRLAHCAVTAYEFFLGRFWHDADREHLRNNVCLAHLSSHAIIETVECQQWVKKAKL